MKNFSYPQFPDLRENGKTTIHQVHNVMFRMLSIFDHICTKYEIDYWLDYGTLLGAVRHKVFIPWDYDLDIGMMRCDYELFLEKGVKELPKDIFFQTKETDPALITEFLVEARLRDKYSDQTFVYKNIQFPYNGWHNGIQLDIFIYDIDNMYENSFSNSFERILSKSQIHLKYEEIEYLDKLEFCGSNFPVPGGYDTYLKRCYGNYWELPPEKERIFPEISVFTPCKHQEILHWTERNL